MTITFIKNTDVKLENIGFLPGSSWAVFAEPVKDGSIHKLKMKAGSKIPPHTHPADEFVYVISGTFKTGGVTCEAGTFIKTTGGTRQGPHEAITDVELLTVRLGALGTFEDE